MASKWIRVAKVKSSSGLSYYTVAHRSDLPSELACDCPAWINSSPRKACKHIAKVVNFMKGTTGDAVRGVNITANGVRLMRELQAEAKVERRRDASRRAWITRKTNITKKRAEAEELMASGKPVSLAELNPDKKVDEDDDIAVRFSLIEIN